MKAVVLPCLALSVLAATALPQVPAGGEFQINTYTSGSQAVSPAGLEMDPSGNAVVGWNGNGANSTRPIMARRFDAAGNLLPEFVVFGPSYPISADGSSVAVDRRGDFVVAWQAAPNTAEDIYGRRYDRAGNALGPAFTVNTQTLFTQDSPQIATDSAGNFVVVWSNHSGDGSGAGIFGQLYDASGTPRGGEFLVNTFTTEGQAVPSVAYDGRGDFVVVWNSWLQDGSESGVFGQRYLASGARAGSEFAVNNSTANRQSFPRVSADRAGNFVIVWQHEGLDGDGYGVMGRLYDPSGAPRGPEFQINQYTTGFQWFAVVDYDDAGNFIVVWTSHGGQDGDRGGVFGQRYDPAGARRGAEFRINTFTTDYQFGPTVASDGVGNFSVVWNSVGQDGDLVGVYGQRFGGLVPAALRVDTTGNGVLEPGEAGDVRPTWRNVNGAAQTFNANISSPGGPTGGIPQILDSVGVYGTVANGATRECTTCYNVLIPNPPVRPLTHWDGSVVETLVPDAQGQQKEWLLHIGRSFADVPSTSPFYRFIETLLHNGVTTGCFSAGEARYCPESNATRDQMAVFVLAAKDGLRALPPCGPAPMFADVPATHAFCPYIEELARRGVVTGCGGGNYCPDAPVTREQMAVFVLRTADPALNPTPCTTPIYNDVPAASPFCRWIEELTRRNVVTGCGGGSYCPASEVTREQMGVFISLTFGLTLYGP